MISKEHIQNLNDLIEKMSKYLRLDTGRNFAELGELESEIQNLKEIKSFIEKLPSELFEYNPSEIIGMVLFTRNDLILKASDAITFPETKYRDFIKQLQENLETDLREAGWQIIKNLCEKFS